jgi:hypothetical protein
MNVRAYWIRLALGKGEDQGEGFSADAWPLGDTRNPHPALSLGKGEAEENAMKACAIRYDVTSLRSRKLSEVHRIGITIQRFN